MEQKKDNPLETRNKIINLLKIRGPSLPIHISKETNLSTLFAGAFLSELVSNNEIKISNMKVGGSPLYYLPGQESQLENFSNYLPGKEREAFQLLKEKKLLEDKKLEPAIRVALRNIKDFAYPLAPIINNEKLIFWRFYSYPETEAKEQIEKLLSKHLIGKQEERFDAELQKLENVVPAKEKKEGIKAEEKSEISAEKPIEKPKRIKPKGATEKEIQLIEFQPKQKPKSEKIAEKSEFVKNINNFLEMENIELLEEREFKKKDYLGVVRINSDLGKLKFLLIAKEKKSISEKDLIQALSKIQEEKLPILFISSGNLNKKAKEFIENYSSLIKFKQI